MPIPKPFAGRRHEVSRLEGFSDAVFAFAVTLLVVSLEVPRTFSELATAMMEFPAFAVCFALLFQVWWRHFNFFRRYGLEDPVTIGLTGTLLFVVLFYVYPLKFVFKLSTHQIFHLPLSVPHEGGGESMPMITPSQTPLLMQIYSCGVIAVFALFALLYRHAYRKRDDLALTPPEVLETRLAVIDNLGIACIGVLSLAIASFGSSFAAALFAGPIYFLIGPFKYALGVYSNRAHKRLAAGTLVIVAAIACGRIGIAATADEAGAAAAAGPMPHATVFAPGVISTGDYDSHAALTPDGRDLYFLRLAPDFSRWTVMVSHRLDADTKANAGTKANADTKANANTKESAHAKANASADRDANGGHWSMPEVAPFSGQWQDADPYVTSDGQHLYFVSDRPLDPGGARRPDHDIWVMDKSGSGWSEPRHLPAPINSDADEWYPIALRNGALYFGSQRKEAAGGGDIYRAVPRGGGSGGGEANAYAVENVGAPVNTAAAEYEAFVTEDERLMLFTATRRPDSLGDFDLYVSHKQPDGRWGEPVNLGPEINSPTRELSPKITPDGKRLEWTSCRTPALPDKPRRRTTAEVLQELHAPGNGLGDIYEIDISAVPALKPRS